MFLKYTALVGLASSISGSAFAASRTDTIATKSSSSAATFGAYFANWAQYHSEPYKHVASDLAPIAGRTDDIYFGFVYFCPPAGTSPMPYWAVTPYGSCTDETEFQLMTVESNDAASMSTMVGFNSANVIASIGGWNFPSSYFSDMVASQASRAKFISSAKGFLQQHKLAGIDIDWEFPCSAPRTGSVKITCQQFRTVADGGGKCPDDTTNFVQFLKELRAGLGADVKITVASQAAEKNARNQGISKESSSYVDAWNIMSYDYSVSDISGAGAQVMSPNAPLYNPSAPALQMSINQTVSTYLSLGVPSNKINVGIPFYGHAWFMPGLTQPDQFGGNGKIQGECCGPFQQTFGAKPGKACSQCGLMMYTEIQAALGGGSEKNSNQVFFDNQTQSAIAYFDAAGADSGYTEAGTWVSFNNKQSIASITKYSLDNNLGGVFIFDTSMDTFSAGNGAWTFELMNSIADILNKTKPSPSPAPAAPSPGAAPAPKGPAPPCSSVGQSKLCSISCASTCRGFLPGFSSAGCIDEADCTNPPSWAKGSVCAC